MLQNGDQIGRHGLTAGVAAAQAAPNLPPPPPHWLIRNPHSKSLFYGIFCRWVGFGKGRLRAKSDLSAAVIDTVADGPLIIDRQGSINAFNPACEWVFAYGATWEFFKAHPRP